MLHDMMTNQYFYYGIIAAGILGLFGTFLDETVGDVNLLVGGGREGGRSVEHR